MTFGRWLFFFTCLGLVQAEANLPSPFKPSQYPKNTARCKATRRAPVEEAVDIQLSTFHLLLSRNAVELTFILCS